MLPGPALLLVLLGTGAAAEALRSIATALAEELVPPVEMAGCSARMLDAAMAALDAADLDATG